MDELPDEVRRIVELIINSFELENVILEEILFDDDEFMPPDQLQGFEEFGEILEPLIGRLLQIEAIEMEVLEDEMVMELIYGRNERVIDWRRNLPQMDYMRFLPDPTFRQHFRMNRPTFEALIVEVGNHLVDQGRLIRLRTELDKCLLMALWIMFNLDTFRATGVIFGVSRGIVHFHYLVVIEALRELAPKFIKWPCAYERYVIKQHFEEQSGYPGVVGALDGILFKCYAPAIQRERYFDRHQSYSVNVQAICDHNMIFRDIYVGEPGSVHDNRVFQRSPIYNLLLESEDLVKDDEHIIADGGYESFSKVLAPYRDLGNLTPYQRNFNFLHSSNRMCVERSFGVLRSKMRRLLKLYVKRYEYLIDHIVSSFVLHNFMRLGGREAEGMCILQVHEPVNARNYDIPHEAEDEDAIRDGEDEDDARDEDVENAQPRRRNFAHPLLPPAKVAGDLKRNAIANQLFNV